MENFGLRTPREMVIAREKMDRAMGRVENVDYGLCPLCKIEMKESSANGIPVHVCLKDRAVFPMKNR